jgi:hypothetical protein
MSENEEVQIAVPKRGRPPKAAVEAVVEAVVEEAAPVEAAEPVASVKVTVDEDYISEQTLREMEAGRRHLNQFK